MQRHLNDQTGNRIQKTQGADVIDYTYVIETNRLNYSSGDRVDNFTYDPLGQLVGLDSEYGDTAFSVQAMYEDDGQLLGKADSWAFNGQGLTFGDTVISFSNPAGEAIFKANLNGKFWLYFYDLSGNLIEQGAPINPAGGGEPMIDHIYLGNRVLASVMGTGNSADYDTCFVATAAFGSPLASELDVFRSFRDLVLMKFTPGQDFVQWYYGGSGSSAAAWLSEHDTARTVTRWVLSAFLYPVKGWVYYPGLLVIGLGAAALLSLAFVKFSGGATFVSRRKRGVRATLVASLVAGFFSLAFVLSVAIYLIAMNPTKAWAQTGQSYTEGEIYYYTLDHIGRPFNLRDSSRNLKWFENHYPFGETIIEDTLGDDMTAGTGSYLTSWKPSFRFPGQYEDDDQFPFVQNHYREYMPEYGSYSTIDPRSQRNVFLPIYRYSDSNPLTFYDPFGLVCTKSQSLANLLLYEGGYEIWNYYYRSLDWHTSGFGQISELITVGLNFKNPTWCSTYAQSLEDFLDKYVPNYCDCDANHIVWPYSKSHDVVEVTCKSECGEDVVVMDPYWAIPGFPILPHRIPR